MLCTRFFRLFLRRLPGQLRGLLGFWYTDYAVPHRRPVTNPQKHFEAVMHDTPTATQRPLRAVSRRDGISNRRASIGHIVPDVG